MQNCFLTQSILIFGYSRYMKHSLNIYYNIFYTPYSFQNMLVRIEGFIGI